MIQLCKKQWNVTYFNNSVKDAILSLPDSIVARYIKLIKLIEVYGSNLGMPHINQLVMAYLSLG